MSGKSMKTIFDVLARDGATPVLNKVSGSFGRMRQAAKNANMALGGMNAGVASMQRRMQGIMAGGVVGAGFLKVGAGLQGLIKESVKQAGDLEYELATLKGISGATAKEMNLLADAAARAGVETQFTPTQAVQGLQNLAQQGFTTAQQLEGLMPALLLSGASGGKVPLADAAKLSAQVVKGFGRAAGDAGIMVDQMVKTTTKSGMAIDDLAGAMQFASSAAQNMEVDFTSTLATLGLIKNVIPSAEVAGSAFQILTARISKPLNQKKLKQNLGIDVVDQATGEFRGFGALLLDISSKFAKMKGGKRAGLIQEIFGPRGMKGIMPLMTQLEKGITTQTGEVLKGQEAWAYWMNELDEDKVKGFAKSMNDMKLDTLTGQMELLTGSVQTFMMELGKGSAQFSKGIVKSFLAAFNTMLSVFQELPQGLKTGIAAFTMISGTVMTFVGAILLARVGLRLFGFSLSGLVMGIGKMLLIAAPLTILFGGIALGAYGIARAVSGGFGKSATKTTTFFDKVKMGFKGMVDIVKLGGLSKETEKEFLKMGKSPMLAAFFKRFIDGWRKAKEFFSGVVKGFDEGLVRLEQPWQRLTDTVGRIFDIWTGGTQRSIKSTNEWKERGEVFGDKLVDISESVLTLTTRFAELGESMAKSFEGVTVDDLIDDLEKVLGAVTSIIGAIADVIRGLNFVGKAIGEGAAEIWLRQVEASENIAAVRLGGNRKELEEYDRKRRAALDPGRLGRPGELDSRTFDAAMAGRNRTREMIHARISGTGEPIETRGQAQEVNNEINRLTRALNQRRKEIIDYQKSSRYDDARSAERSILKDELAKIQKALQTSPQVIEINVDGKRLFEVVTEKQREDREDSFDDPNMSPVTSGG
jgi:TP901 family phage tail tape measure protein